MKIKFLMNGKDDEWMWLEIMDFHSSSEGNSLIVQGVLRNDSIFNSDFSYGTPVPFYRTDIADYCKGGDFDNYDPWMPHGNILHEQHE